MSDASTRESGPPLLCPRCARRFAAHGRPRHPPLCPDCVVPLRAVPHGAIAKCASPPASIALRRCGRWLLPRLRSSIPWLMAAYLVVARNGGESLRTRWFAGLAILTLSLALAAAARRRWPARRVGIRIAGWAAIPPALLAYWSVARSTTVIETRIVNQVLVVAVTKTWTGVPVHERATVRGSGLVDSGPLTPSGKRHGPWQRRNGLRTEPIWYWYGEPVTEGEFALRNR